MDLDFILNLIKENGYRGLFVWLWFGSFGIPIPNEVIIMTVGFVASLKILNPIITFVVTYCGILAAVTTSYLLGRYVGRPFMGFFEKRKRFSKKVDAALRMIDRYHAFSLSLSYFLPGVRFFVPFLYGVSRLPYRTFAVFAYFGVLVWLSIIFTIGYYFSDNIDKILSYSHELLLGFVVMCISYVVFRILRRRSRKESIRHQGPHG